MVKVVENGERICTVTLDGSESSIVFQNDYKYFAVKNESDAAVYVSLTRDIVEGADGVMTIGSKESAVFPCMKPNVNMFFIKGTGKIQVIASSTPVNPFKSAPVADSGGGKTVTVSNPNLLINPDFRINQRERTDFQVSYHQGAPILASQVYTVDRWRIMGGEVSITDGKFVLNGTIIQALENSIGANFIASVSVSDGSAVATYNDETKIFSIVGENATLNWAKLEIGSVATPFFPPDPGMELMKCYRFFYRVGRYISNPNYNETSCRIYNRMKSRSCVYTGIILPVEMRIAPTVSISGTPWTFRLLDTNGGNQVVFDATKISVDSQKRSCGLTFTDDYFANGVDGTICSLAAGYTDFDAEIY